MNSWLGWLGKSKNRKKGAAKKSTANAGCATGETTIMTKSSLEALSEDERKYNFLLDLNDAESVKKALVSHLVHTVGKDPELADDNDWFFALASMLRGLLSERHINTMRDCRQKNPRRVYYLSMEWLLGSSLRKNLLDFGIMDITREALSELGRDFEDVAAVEHDPALGNGGLGRLAACFLESMVSQGFPGGGYGLRYDFGLFHQDIKDGSQVERPDAWLKFGSPWEFQRVTHQFSVRFYGHTLCRQDKEGRKVCKWLDTSDVMAMAYDFPMSGFRNNKVTNLRLWAARATDAFNLQKFNRGNYIESVEEKTNSEILSKILYPDDTTLQGQELRLKQEYFFVSASVQDILARYLESNDDLGKLHEKVVIQMNDTHPAMGVAELMRILVDEKDMNWGEAWEVTRKTFAFTNHTLLPEALERWPMGMMRHVLPRLLEIILDINAWFMKEVRSVEPHDPGRTYVMSIVDDSHQAIRMANLAIVGSYRVNGVAQLHSDLLRGNVFPEFDHMYPGRFTNVTNGVTPRRWLLQANPDLSKLICEIIGDKWMYDLSHLEGLTPYADDEAFQQRFMAVKDINKKRMANMVARELNIKVSPSMLHDTQIKRIHEYKRQLLNLLHVITRYNRIKAGKLPKTPRLATFGGKAAPGYFMAKQIIRLINDVATTINNDKDASEHLKVAFMPNYSATMAEVLMPGTDLSEQVSTAGTEASGTGNMKFAMNGALTIGTMDGANIEIHDAVGEDNIFIFGMNEDEVTALRADHYNPWLAYGGNDELKQVIDMIGNGAFCPDEPGRYSGVSHALLDGGDHYLLLADYASYMQAQELVDEVYQDKKAWARKAILNTANMGYFSSDRSIQEYAKNIWNITPMV